MKSTRSAPFGSWKSPISSKLIVSDAVSLDEVQLLDDTLYYIERRPKEQGRCVIVQSINGNSDDILPAPYSARSRVHEYGGGVYCIGDKCLYFVNDTDQNIYRLSDGTAHKLTNHPEMRFADLTYDIVNKRIVSVCEKHVKTEGTPLTEPENSIVSVNIETGVVTTLCEGYDFYSNPRTSPDGRQLCWCCWNHPNMPWDGTELWLAELGSNGQIYKQYQIAGKQNSSISSEDNISICQPLWSPDNQLYFISDQNNWWQIYRYDTSGSTLVTHKQQDIGQPQWVFGQASYAFTDSSHILVCHTINGKNQVVIIEIENPDHTVPLPLPWSSFAFICANHKQIAFIAASATSFPTLVRLETERVTNDVSQAIDQYQTIRVSTRLPVNTDYFSQAQRIEYLNRHGQTVFANYYAPTNPDYRQNSDEKPPLIVICHGGPTACADTALDPRKQFWTSRGFALLDVNYSGSSGFGRKYRQRLNGLWGILDVEDCCDGALHLVEQGLADRNRLIIRGSSAGGFTVLCALTFHQVFSAGASYYGISELESLAKDTHKFEARYLDRLVGPYPLARKKYTDRSPLFHADQLNCPVIFFQGIEDRVVPKEQAEKMIDALDKKGIAVAGRFFEGEQHGFRQAETIVTTLGNELYFYSRVFDFDSKDGLPLEIKNHTNIVKPGGETK